MGRCSNAAACSRRQSLPSLSSQACKPSLEGLTPHTVCQACALCSPWHLRRDKCRVSGYLNAAASQKRYQSYSKGGSRSHGLFMRQWCITHNRQQSCNALAEMLWWMRALHGTSGKQAGAPCAGADARHARRASAATSGSSAAAGRHSRNQACTPRAATSSGSGSQPPACVCASSTWPCFSMSRCRPCAARSRLLSPKLQSERFRDSGFRGEGQPAARVRLCEQHVALQLDVPLQALRRIVTAAQPSRER